MVSPITEKKEKRTPRRIEKIRRQKPWPNPPNERKPSPEKDKKK